MLGKSNAATNVTLCSLVRLLWRCVSSRFRSQASWVQGHSSVAKVGCHAWGNAQADRLAKEGANPWFSPFWYERRAVVEDFSVLPRHASAPCLEGVQHRLSNTGQPVHYVSTITAAITSIALQFGTPRRQIRKPTLPRDHPEKITLQGILNTKR